MTDLTCVVCGKKAGFFTRETAENGNAVQHYCKEHYPVQNTVPARPDTPAERGDIHILQYGDLLREITVSTLEGIPGKEIREALGIVRGSTVRSRNVVSDAGAGLKCLARP